MQSRCKPSDKVNPYCQPQANSHNWKVLQKLCRFCQDPAATSKRPHTPPKNSHTPPPQQQYL
eukprot:10922385-Ditylum_brightwellii.AAC.1